ncbi:uncharacterized protein BYT42DRAFT_509384 [Radiomyces spectabilis]|uniref:uncharacterized protein n=1 Tax=Radiomyces spectabilis TaxID=64574 RepID=UPI00221F4AE0|nr:uncharacterized protein BYT42DRAFT_509384 [Radiomyces spectabilis]KAI8391391.1 hypothetical protein BYT42DRAFT_509384 [Radiomyces spectabilis]
MSDSSSHTNTFLKNLSQKKYAWMQTPTAPYSPPAKPSSPVVTATHSTHPPSTTHTTAKSSPSIRHTPSSTSSSTSASTFGTAPEDSPRKKQRQHKRPLHEDRDHSSFHSRIKSSPVTVPTASPSTVTPLPSSPSMDTQHDDTSSNQALDSTPQPDQPRFKYTSFPVKGFNILPTRNITSTFVRSDTTYIPGNKAGSEAIAPNAEEEWRDTIIIHPGSRNLRIGLASEAFPRTVPHVIARRMKAPSAVVNKQAQKMDIEPLPTEMDTDEATAQPPTVDAENSMLNRDDALFEIKNELKWRMKNAKRRAVPNAEAQVSSFNRQAVQETIPDHNDPYKVEWTEIPQTGDKPAYFVGDKALNLPIADDSEYRLFYPWQHGTLNKLDYPCLEAVLGDLQTIWAEMIYHELEIEDTTFENYNVVLIVPDLLERAYVCELMTLLLRYMKFRGAFVQQESICATFGAGVSSACVVDIGAQTTKIACIEEGVCLADSRMSIPIGGDDITKTFTSFLLSNHFPYADINLAKAYDWRIAEELKEKWCTMNEADISVQVYDFFVRAPYKPTIKYQCKVYDEVFLAPLCLVYPAILDTHTKEVGSWTNADVVDDIAEESTSGSTLSAAAASLASRSKPTVTSSQASTPKQTADYPDTPVASSTSLAGTASSPPASHLSLPIAPAQDMYPIDIAIAQSIQAASVNTDERLKRLFINIILVGGGGMISNFSRILEDRILSTVIAQTARVEKVEVLPAPRELDPRLLVWKGASVFSKLDTAKDMWIGQEEWNEVGARCLKDRALLI